MEFNKDNYAGVGLVKYTDPNAHPLDHRKIKDDWSNGLTKLEWFVGQGIASGLNPEEALAAAKDVIERLAKNE